MSAPPADRANWMSQVAGAKVAPPKLESVADIALWRAFREEKLVPAPRELPEVQARHEHVVLRKASEGSLTAEVYVPLGHGPFPPLLFLHGGGWCSGSAEAARLPAMKFAEQGFCVTNLNYRLAPEHRFPSAIEDVIYAIRWIGANSDTYRSEGPVFVVGSSAGANLGAGAIAFLTSDRLDGREQYPALAGAVFFYGIFDFRTLRPSQGSLDGGVEIMFNLAYLGDRFLTLHEDFRVSPILAPNLDRFPPVFVSCGQMDTLLDQSLMMTQALAAANVPTTLSVFPGAHHGFLRLDHVIPQVKSELTRTYEWLRSTARDTAS